MGFKALQEIALSDPLEVLAKVNEKKDSFLSLITKPVEADMHILIIQILSKVCLSSFDELKLRLLLDICQSQYLMYLKNYLMELPYTEEKRRNRFYWNNQDEFWKHLISFCESVFNMAPSVAMQKCRSLIEGSLKLCLEELNNRHSFVIAKESETRLADLRERLTAFEKKTEVGKLKLVFVQTVLYSCLDDIEILIVVLIYPLKPWLARANDEEGWRFHQAGTQGVKMKRKHVFPNFNSKIKLII